MIEHLLCLACPLNTPRVDAFLDQFSFLGPDGLLQLGNFGTDALQVAIGTAFLLKQGIAFFFGFGNGLLAGVEVAPFFRRDVIDRVHFVLSVLALLAQLADMSQVIGQTTAFACCLPEVIE
ncbi:hypothetical protein JZU56_00215, partial [bacterium]|nr:hypothetical protein [bacterium]